MKIQGKKARAILLLLLYPLFLIGNHACAKGNTGSIILFEKQIEDQANQYKLLVTRQIIHGNDKLCEIAAKCNTAILRAQYIKNNKIVWSHEDQVRDCAYDITLELFSDDVVFDVTSDIPRIAIGYEKLCSSSFDPTTVVVAGYNNNKSYTIKSDDALNSSSHIRGVELIEKLIVQRKTHFLDTENVSSPKLVKKLDDLLANDKYFVKSIDVNNDGILDKVVSSKSYQGDDLYLYVRKDSDYELVFRGSNLTEDGGLVFRTITAEHNDNEVFSITTFFPDGGLLEAKHLISFSNNEWILKRTQYKTTNWQADPSKMYICNVTQNIKLSEFVNNSNGWEKMKNIPAEKDRDSLCRLEHL